VRKKRLKSPTNDVKVTIKKATRKIIFKENYLVIAVKYTMD